MEELKEPDPDSVVATLVRDLRAATGLAQDQFALAVGVNRRNVIRWEGGETEPSASNLLRMLDVAGKGIEEHGVAASSVSGEIRDLRGVLERLEERLSEIAEQQQQVFDAAATVAGAPVGERVLARARAVLGRRASDREGVRREGPEAP